MWGFLAGLVTSIFGALLNNTLGGARESDARNENYQLNEMSAANADQRTRNLYHDLQSPQALAQQYKDAGLSPSLMFGGGGVGGQTTQGAQGGGAAGISPTTFGIDPLAGAQLELIKAQADKTKAETDTIEGKNERGAAEIDDLIQNVNSKYLKNVWQSYNNRVEAVNAAIAENFGYEKANAELQLLYNEGERVYQAGVHLYQENIIQGSTMDAIIMREREQLTKLEAEITLMRAQTELTRANVTLTNEQVSALYQKVLQDWQLVHVEQDRVQVNREQLQAQIEQWGLENGLTERAQNIEAARILTEFIDHRITSNEERAKFLMQLYTGQVGRTPTPHKGRSR